MRAVCNFLVVGSQAARLIRQLEPHFKPAAGLDSLVPTGPYELGTLDGRLIIHDPLMAQSGILFGFKGDNYLFSGFLFAPYIPLENSGLTQKCELNKSLNCWDHSCISEYDVINEAENIVKMSEWSQSAAKSYLMV